MEDSQKKGGAGARGDISDLKARLGLKKSPGAATAAPAGGAPSLTPSSVPRVGPQVPPPPGFGPPGAQASVAPAVDPRRDPFAAPAAAAPATPYYGYAPLPGVDDGRPVEALSRPKPWGRIGGVLGATMVVAMAGFTLGKIQWARANMNKTIDQATDIKAEVDKMSKTLALINDRVNQSAEAAKGNPDMQLAADLGTLELKRPEQDRIFKTNYYYLDDLAIDSLFNYYNDTIILYDLIAKNAKKTEADKEAIGNFVKTSASKAEQNYGVTVDASGPIPLAHMVEMGGPVCQDEKKTDCNANELKGFKYRTDSGGQWFVKPVKGPIAQTVTPIQKTPLFVSVAAGSADILAVKDHVRRNIEIRMLTVKLFNEQKVLLEKLEKAADPHRKVNEYLVF